MTSKTNPFEDRRRPWIVINGPLFPALPSTTTILALGIMGGVLMFTPMVALIGDRVPEQYRPAVVENLELMRDALLLVLGYYFSKVVNAGEQSMAMRAIQVAREAPAQSRPVPEDAAEAAAQTADAAQAEAEAIAQGERHK